MVLFTCIILCSYCFCFSLISEKTLKELILSQAERERDVAEFISDIKPGIDIDCVCINDVYGPTAYRADLQCLMLTADTAKGGVIVNEMRANNVRRMMSITRSVLPNLSEIQRKMRLCFES